MIFEQITSGGCQSYLVGCDETSIAALIDPEISHVDRYLALAAQTDLQAAARQLAGYGPREIVLTQSSGVTVWADGQLYQAPFTPRSLAGRTGRGDTCFASYLGWRLRASPEEATRLAAAVTTQKQERPGPWRGTLADLPGM